MGWFSKEEYQVYMCKDCGCEINYSEDAQFDGLCEDCFFDRLQEFDEE